jgi:hypothetical protein
MPMPIALGAIGKSISTYPSSIVRFYRDLRI